MKAQRVNEALGDVLKGKPIIYDVEEVDGEYEYYINNDLVEEMLKRFIPEISQNEIERFLVFTLDDILQQIPTYMFEKGDIDAINRKLYRDIQSDSKFWMQLHSDVSMRSRL